MALMVPLIRLAKWKRLPPLATSAPAIETASAETDPLLRLAASYRDRRRAVIFGPDLAVICGLMRVGYQQVTELRRGSVAPEGEADLVIVGESELIDAKGAVADLAAVITRARRALRAGGHLILSLPARRMPMITVAALKGLRHAGFNVWQPWFEPERILIAGVMGAAL